MINPMKIIAQALLACTVGFTCGCVIGLILMYFPPIVTFLIVIAVAAIATILVSGDE